LKIVWNSVAPWIGTGYGQQTAIFTPRIRDLGHDIVISSYVGLDGTIGTWNDIKVYPRDLTGFNKYMLRKYVERHAEGGDPSEVLVITLQDVWVWLQRQYGGIADYKGLRMAAWVPIDHDPAPPNVVEALEAFNVRPIAMSKFGQDRLEKAGLDPLYVPHGVDPAMTPQPDREEIREYMKVPKDAFVVGMVANNQGIEVPRKAFTQVFAAFSIFREKHTDAVLYLHTDALGLNQGINLVAFAEECGIPNDAIAVVNQERYWLGEITPAQLARIYSAFDVLVNPSLGEGFGIPIVEAQACGTPVIVTDWTSMPELVGAGWIVDGDPWFRFGAGSWWKVPSIAELIQALEMAYEARGDEDLRAKAHNFARQYHADYVLEKYWKPALEALDAPREVPPLPLNRAARRRRAKLAA